MLQSTLVLFLSDADVYEEAGNSLNDDDGNGKSYLYSDDVHAINCYATTNFALV